ncbi:DHH family phosphoesterase [Chitinivibrio alkaliphilus]|uniref:Phosphoesterase DHHA1 n=1 Tax=Chitinivibrio alkaliphilus ACht1 TaxID=1313304 RepID=U7D333_9BACT|nr:DHH family phosphoesterase [Chitinivibrio alkaliphilus]ERP30904.1 phosphoesterase DHHA1 [Chitinivibrio alkaliphilus ACht1]
MTSIEHAIKEKYNDFCHRILSGHSALILTHNFPDPDGLAASMGLKRFFEHHNMAPCTVSFSGFIGRAENREMIQQVNLAYEPFQKINLKEYERIIVVDTLPKNGNISIGEDVEVDAILDHHGDNKSIPDYDAVNLCFPEIGATSTIVYLLLKMGNIPIDTTLATALFYGIKTDTMNMARNYCDDDIIAYKELFDLMDHKILSRIENPKREPQYLQYLHQGIEAFFTYNNFGYTHIGKVPVPDYIPEMADIFHKLDKLEWIVCSGFFGNSLLFSIRSLSENRAGIYAYKLATIFNGSGGGHSTMAAGRIPAHDIGAELLLDRFQHALFSVFSINPESKKHVLDLTQELPSE